MRELWRLAGEHRWALALAGAMTLAASAAALAQPLAAEAVVDALGDGRETLRSVLLLGGLVLVSAALAGAGTWLLDRTGEHVVLGIRRGLAFRLTRLRVVELDRHPQGDLVARATSDSNLMRTAATTGLVELVDGSLSLLATFALMLYLDARLTVVTLVVLAAVAAVVGVILPRIRAAVIRSQEAVGALGAAMDRALGAARTVKANSAEARETARIDAASQRGYQAGIVGARYSGLVTAVIELSVQASFLAILAVGGSFVAGGSLSVSTLVAFLLAVFYLTAPIASLAGGATQLQEGLGAAARLRVVTDLELEDDVAPPTVRPSAGRAPELRVDRLSFAYPGRPPALRELTLTIPANGVTALVGPSGAGKSTLFALLLRFYEPDAGAILLDGTDIAASSRAAVRTRLAWVDQDSSMLSGTIADNLRFGAPEATDDELRCALDEVRLDGLVRRLPDGVDSEVGGRGIALSGGERQRLAIARALLRRADVLLLDEATSALDAVNETALRETIQRVARQSTVVVIAHRIATVTIADRIAVLDAGTLRAVGTHAELVAGCPLYRDLTAHQLVGTAGMAP